MTEAVQTTIRALVKLLDLEYNWDSYGAPRIGIEGIIAAIRFVDSTFHDDMLAPSVVPTSGGGVQLEWHVDGVDREMEFSFHGTMVGCLLVPVSGGGEGVE